MTCLHTAIGYVGNSNASGKIGSEVGCVAQGFLLLLSSGKPQMSVAVPLRGLPPQMLALLMRRMKTRVVRLGADLACPPGAASPEVLHCSLIATQPKNGASLWELSKKYRGPDVWFPTRSSTGNDRTNAAFF
jgi:hypothetical protein